MPEYRNPQLSYYYAHREERSAYARKYYQAKKQNSERKPRRRYKTWKSNGDLIYQHKQYLIDNQITSVSISFTS
jgi:hypothetical protein